VHGKHLLDPIGGGAGLIIAVGGFVNWRLRVQTATVQSSPTLSYESDVIWKLGSSVFWFLGRIIVSEVLVHDWSPEGSSAHFIFGLGSFLMNLTYSCDTTVEEC
jgi:hypothetical protein